MTRTEKLEQTQERLALYLQAERAILAGAQSYSIGNRTLTRADLRVIRDQIQRLNSDCMQLARGAGIRVQRVVPRDGI